MDELLAQYKQRGWVSSERVEDAIRRVDRADYVPEEMEDAAYADTPLRIGHGQTISQPGVVFLMVELLGSEPGDKVLDVGSGSGYTAAILGELTGISGRVIGVERIPDLVRFATLNLATNDYPHVEIHESIPDVYGFPAEAPFDRILVSAAATEIPEDLLDQLRVGGVMVIPVGEDIVKVTKTEQGTQEERVEGFRFVPLKRESFTR